MTREEAIKICQALRTEADAWGEDEASKAIDIAIEALKREPQKSYPTEWCEQCTLWEDNKCMGVARCKSNIKALKHLMNDDLISRAEAIEAIDLVDWYHQNKNKDMVHGANSDEHQAWYKAEDIYEALEAVPSANRPRGEWHYSDGKPATIGQSFGVICDQCGTESEYCTNFCGECGADMRGEDE